MGSLRESLQYAPVELAFGTSGLRGLVRDMTDLECYINTRGFLRYVTEQTPLAVGGMVCLAGDLRQSTPRIMTAVGAAIADAGLSVHNLGFVPTPTLALAAQVRRVPGIMVTGSHIPDDRNGIKFYLTNGEVLKADEAGIKAAVAAIRADVYAADDKEAPFNPDGSLKGAPLLPRADIAPVGAYLRRYGDVFAADALKGKHVVVYQHSAVGRDLLVRICEELGARVTTVGRTDVFTPIDTENVTPDDQAYFRQLAERHPDVHAIISTDGDSDRPFVIDERGVFHRGDELGAVVASVLEADYAAIPVSSSDAVTTHLTHAGISFDLTKIGSPHVIVAMQAAVAAGRKRVVGWEVNGGFLLGSDVEYGRGKVGVLPTRDALLPILVPLVTAAQRGVPVSALFGLLPARFTAAGLIDDFPPAVSAELVRRYSEDTPVTRDELSGYFSTEHGFGDIVSINALDGVRITFSSGDIAHLRPSGNAPQLRLYSVADSQARADEIVALALAEPDGIFRRMQRAVTNG